MGYLGMYRNHTEDEIRNVEKDIESFIKTNDLMLCPRTDIVKVCKKIGFRVLSLSLPQGVDGVILVKEGKKLIGISNLIAPQSARFVVAHELAHYIHELRTNSEEELFFAMKDSILHNEEKSLLEHEMDLMAAAILVPKENFLQDMKRLQIEKTRDIKKAAMTEFSVILSLAEKYDVDEDLIIRRIVEVSCYA